MNDNFVQLVFVLNIIQILNKSKMTKKCKL